jgi:hypothetical protein
MKGTGDRNWRWATTGEVAHLSGYSAQWVRHLMDEGRIIGERTLTGRLIFARAEVERFLADVAARRDEAE